MTLTGELLQLEIGYRRDHQNYPLRSTHTSTSILRKSGPSLRPTSWRVQRDEIVYDTVTGLGHELDIVVVVLPH